MASFFRNLGILQMVLTFIIEVELSEMKTVVTTKARGRLGNHLWTLMTLMSFKLNYNVDYYVSEETKQILRQYFLSM